MAPTSTTVRHITKDHVVITPAKDYFIATFKIGSLGGNVEVIVASNDGLEAFRLLVAGPSPDQTMTIGTDDDGVVDILYLDKPDAS